MRRLFWERIEKLMGAELKGRDLGFVAQALPISELEQLKKIAGIDSATLNVEGVNRIQGIVAEKLESLGFKIQSEKGQNRFGELIVAERPGDTPYYVTLITHSDTVLGNYREFAIDQGALRATGSGVIDNKGGLVVGLSALERFLRHLPQTRLGLRFICSPNEEMGSTGFTERFRELGKDTLVGFGLEPALDTGNIIHQRRGNRWYDITIEGREAHAGRSYGEHANAAHDFALKAAELSRLTNYKKHISVNVGHVEGGKDRHNIVCGRVHVKLDVRFPSFEVRDKLHQKIEKILTYSTERSTCGRYTTSTRYEIVDDCPPFTLTRRSKRLARTFAALITQVEGKKVYSHIAGGAGDVNYLATDKNFILDGLGPVGGAMHTHDEFIQVETLGTRSQALAGFLDFLQTAHLESFK